MTKFVIYSSDKDDDIVVTTKKNEEKAITIYFNEKTGRDIQDYDRQEIDDIAFGIEIRNSIWIG